MCASKARDPDDDLDPDAVSNDVEVVKAVVWWYDPGHEDGNTIADIDLRLLDDSTVPPAELGDSDSSTDNKEQIFVTDLQSNVEPYLQIQGQYVPSDTVCGTNSVNVHWAFFYEDSDRDDTDGPSSSEIYPEDQ